MRILLLLALAGLCASKPTGELPAGVKTVMATAADSVSAAMNNVNVKEVVATAADSISATMEGMGEVNVKEVMANAADSISSTMDGMSVVGVKEAMANAADSVSTTIEDVNVKEVLANVADSISAIDVKGIVASNVETLGHVAQAKAAILKYSGEAIGEAAAAAGSAAADYAGEIDAIAALDKAEASVIASKTAAISGVFDAKRNLVKGLQKVKEDHKENLLNMLNKTMTGINIAINTTADGITVTKETVSDYAEEVTLENAKAVLANALNATLSVIEQTSSSLIGALVATKMKLHEAAANFDSKETFQGTRETIGATVSASLEKTEDAVDQIGVFGLIDGLVQSIADVPIKINQIIAKAEVETQLGVQKAVEETVHELAEIEDEKEEALEEFEEELEAIKEEAIEDLKEAEEDYEDLLEDELENVEEEEEEDKVEEYELLIPTENQGAENESLTHF